MAPWLEYAWKKYAMTILMACPLLHTISGQTVISGRVTDASTFEPVVFANVVFKGTAIGVKTDFEGSFVLSANTSNDSITISFIGYESRTLAVRPGIDQHLDVILQPAVYSLQEVTIKPGGNPAHTILRNFREHHEQNAIRKLESYQFDNYSRTTVYIRRFGDHEKQRTGGFFSEEFEKFGIKTGEENIPALPAYMTETFSTNYYMRSPARQFTHIKAVNSEGLAFEDTELVSQLISKQENIDLSENNVLIADKSFVSPLSGSGTLYYKYYLIDTVLIDNRYACFEIRVMPRREEDPVFSGTIWIHDTTFALKRISVEVSEKSEINFIRRIKIQQDYEPADGGAWFPIRTRFLVDAANIFAANFSHKTNIRVNRKYDPGFFSSELKINNNVSAEGEEFWEARRINSFDHTDSLAAEKIDALRENRKMVVSAKIVEASIKGYYDLGKFELGPWIMFYNHNKVEGSRIRIGGRTNQSFSKLLFMEGYLAWGNNDNRLKGSLMTEVVLSRQRWARIGAMYRDDLERNGAMDEFYSGSSFLTFATTFGGSDKMIRSQVARTWLEADIAKGLTGKISLTRKTFEPVSPDFIFAWFTDSRKSAWSPDYVTSESCLSLSYQPKAVYVTDGMRRFPVDFNKFPMFSFSWFRGIDDFPDSDFSYDKISAGISGNLNLGGFGHIGYNLIHTKVFDPLPYPLLINPAGNESVFRTGRTYNLMNYGEFVADNATELMASYHMNGLIMNKIPLIKKLNLRTVLSTHCIAGSFDENRNGFYDAETNPGGILPPSINGVPLTGFHPLSYDRPYAELAYGLENIFRFIRVDLVHRLTWLENTGARRFALKFSGVFRF